MIWWMKASATSLCLKNFRVQVWDYGKTREGSRAVRGSETIHKKKKDLLLVMQCLGSKMYQEEQWPSVCETITRQLRGAKMCFQGRAFEQFLLTWTAKQPLTALPRCRFQTAACDGKRLCYGK